MGLEEKNIIHVSVFSVTLLATLRDMQLQLKTLTHTNVAAI